MNFSIIGSFDKNTLYCTGSFTKLLTTFVTLSLLAEKYNLYDILDDDEFLDRICVSGEARDFLTMFQRLLGKKFSIHDLCSYYAGLPYTFDVSEQEIEAVDAGKPFKHHSILDEKTFLYLCAHKITPVYSPHSKFNYSELAIIFLGYLIEKIYAVKIDTLFYRFVIDRFRLTNSAFSRTRLPDAYVQDLSDIYDYPAIAVQDHGYFCYSNGYYTTLNDTKKLLENLLPDSVFRVMTDINIARAASNRLMNGLTIEIRKVGDDLIFGYEGLSYSGCNNWAYSTKLQQGYITFTNTEEEAYDVVFGRFGYQEFDIVPDSAQVVYRDYLKNYRATYVEKDIPHEFQGQYLRVDINDKHLDTLFTVGKNFIVIRNPDEVRFDLVFDRGIYRIKTKDNMAGENVNFYVAKSGRHYFSFAGNLYRQV